MNRMFFHNMLILFTFIRYAETQTGQTISPLHYN